MMYSLLELLEQVFFAIKVIIFLPWFCLRYLHKKQIYKLKHKADGFFSTFVSSPVEMQRLSLASVLGTGFSLSARLQIW